MKESSGEFKTRTLLHDIGSVLIKGIMWIMFWVLDTVSGLEQPEAEEKSTLKQVFFWFLGHPREEADPDPFCKS